MTAMARLAGVALTGLILNAVVGHPAAAEMRQVGEILLSRGAVTAERTDGPVALAPGAPIYLADQIVTGPKARAKLRFSGGTVVALGAESRLNVAEYASEAGQRESSILSLLGGILRITVSPTNRPARFDLQTQTAVASARSTDFIVEARPETSAVFVIEGRVAVARPDGRDEVELDPGFGTDVAAGAAPKAPKKWGQKRVEDVLARTHVP
ncbi:MAG: FecR family protein [Alphaproteobacteria bacterium]|nr:FecR family protein [Alphaproteobacteria bacterium]